MNELNIIVYINLKHCSWKSLNNRSFGWTSLFPWLSAVSTLAKIWLSYHVWKCIIICFVTQSWTLTMLQGLKINHNHGVFGLWTLNILWNLRQWCLPPDLQWTDDAAAVMATDSDACHQTYTMDCWCSNSDGNGPWCLPPDLHNGLMMQQHVMATDSDACHHTHTMLDWFCEGSLCENYNSYSLIIKCLNELETKIITVYSNCKYKYIWRICTISVQCCNPF